MLLPAVRLLLSVPERVKVVNGNVALLLAVPCVIVIVLLLTDSEGAGTLTVTFGPADTCATPSPWIVGVTMVEAIEKFGAVPVIWMPVPLVYELNARVAVLIAVPCVIVRLLLFAVSAGGGTVTVTFGPGDAEAIPPPWIVGVTTVEEIE